LIFDFDGVIVDTESPEYEAWQEIYRQHGAHLPLELWVECIGRAPGYFDPCADLEGRIGRSLDRAAIETQQRTLWLERVSGPRCPGVADWIAQATQLSLLLGIASSSSRQWVTGHLERLGLSEGWTCIKCRGDVPQAKPAPDLYVAALLGMGLEPDEAFAIEDSPNGIAAAKAAGLLCVAVPGPLTQASDLSRADLRLASLTDRRLAEVIRELEITETGA
jgi:HAD superfamily hydrolase (TIGR01509 family)